jgi:hypothetical protein
VKTKSTPTIVILLITTLLVSSYISAHPAGPPTAATAGSANYGLELVGQIGGAVGAVAVHEGRAYVGEGPRLTVLDIATVSPTILGRSTLTGQAVEDVAVVEKGERTYAYVAAGTGGLRILDVTNPATPLDVASLTLDVGPAYHITVAGDYAYVSASVSFQIVDISNPTAPAKKGRYNTGAGPVGRVVSAGDYVYVPAALYGGVQVVKVVNPNYPSRVTSFSTLGGSPRAVVIDGAYAYVVSQSSGGGLFLYDISTPQAPAFMRYYPFYNYYAGAVVGNTLYLLGSDLLVLDTADPTAITHRGTYPVGQNALAMDVAQENGLVYVANDVAGLKIIDVDLTVAERGYYYPPGEVQVVRLAGDYAYLGVSRNYDEGKLRIVDVSNPAAPQERAVYQPLDGGYLADVAVTPTADYAYLLYDPQSPGSHMHIVDISQPDGPKGMGSIGSPDVELDSPAAFAVTGAYAYTVGYKFHVIDLHEPMTPTLVATTASAATDITLHGHYAYLAMRYGGLQVVDIMTPTTPTIVGAYTPEHQSYGTKYIAVGDGPLPGQTYAYLSEQNRITVFDVSDPTTPAPVHDYVIVETGVDLMLTGSKLFVAMEDDGLVVLDVSTPTQIREALTLPYWDAYSTVVDAGRLYIAAGWRGLRVLDAGNLTPAIRSGAYDLSPTRAANVTVDGTYAYIADRNAGLKVVDISNPAAPLALGKQELAGDTYDVALNGHLAYVANYGNDLSVVDVSNPAAPELVGETADPHFSRAWAVALHNDIAYVASRTDGLHLADLTHPLTPTLLHHYWPDQSIVDVEIRATATYTHAYLTSDGGAEAGLRILDVTHPMSITEVGAYDTWLAQDVALDGRYAYVAAGGDGLRIVDVANVAAPTEAGAYATSGDASDVIVNGSHAYLLETTGLRIVDIANGQRPVEVGAYRVNNTPVEQMAMRGNVAYLATGGGLHIVAIANPSHPQLLGVYEPANGAVYGVALAEGSIAALYVRTDTSEARLHIVDVSNPTDVQLLGTYSGHADRLLAVLGNLLYLRGEQGGTEVYIVDISNPASPVDAGYYDAYGVYGAASDMVIAGNYGYLSFGNYGIHTLDLSSPTQPSRMAAASRSAFNLTLAGDRLFAAGYYGNSEGVYIYDIANPAQLVRLGHYELEGVEGAAAAGSYLYAADRYVGLRILNVSNPASPVEVASYQTPSGIQHLAVGAYIYLLENNGALRVVDAATPATPHQVAFYQLPEAEAGARRGLALAGAYLYVANDTGGVYVLRATGEAPPPEYDHWVYLPLITR